MSNHFHILLEVPPMPEDGISDGELLRRLATISGEAFVAGVSKELGEARAEEDTVRVAEIHARFTYRMHNLSEYMKTVLQRFTRWFNRKHERTGTLWEERYKSVIVESGTAARTMAAYIDLNCPRSAHAMRFAISSSGNGCVISSASAKGAFSAGGDGGRSGGVSLEQLRGGGWWRKERQR